MDLEIGLRERLGVEIVELDGINTLDLSKPNLAGEIWVYHRADETNHFWLYEL